MDQIIQSCAINTQFLFVTHASIKMEEDGCRERRVPRGAGGALRAEQSSPPFPTSALRPLPAVGRLSPHPLLLQHQVLLGPARLLSSQSRASLTGKACRSRGAASPARLFTGDSPDPVPRQGPS